MPAPSFQPTLLVFDLDGTLVDTRQDLANAVNHALHSLGRPPLPLAHLTACLGDGARMLLTRALPGGSAAEIEAGLRRFREFYAEHLLDHSRLYPGVRETLRHFAGKKKALLSNKPQEFVTAMLQRLQLAGHFDMIVGGHPARKLKPDPQSLLDILANLGVAPVSALIIGDGENDLIAGRAAGIATCAVLYGYRPAETLLALQPDYTVQALPELISLIT
ncbi:MAG: HAD-IA family hydrolase [candidate division KSB1 bacterium]|nr:HAD-IA family hydrolase [candidate division KSB1 bacterium]MDZ7275613.1 HAD-IA family hydrolase [candidate division KSB1 bacterium]MDZ7284696.1 HAD-IA family hydrolase [candidate division KSB1 bacterium]MDZ7297885.1 HAD-IA family hydrolase [candidate division KSB1 bacterium]MDZ7305987.1 HAD-IA family hydrolase [candidate division KSB1 bacterium]